MLTERAPAGLQPPVNYAAAGGGKGIEPKRLPARNGRLKRVTEFAGWKRLRTEEYFPQEAAPASNIEVLPGKRQAELFNLMHAC